MADTHPEDLYRDWEESQRLKQEKRNMTMSFDVSECSPEVLKRIGFDES